MKENPETIEHLMEKAEALLRRQDALQKEIADLHTEISRLQAVPAATVKPAGPEAVMVEILAPAREEIISKHEFRPVPKATPSSAGRKLKFRSDLEKFIGENLINKIGIAVTIIGVGIGAKYAIDHQLISPWTRIFLGYLVGLGLFGFAFRLKKQYENYSAVLLSGSMAIFYFISYAAYSFYDLIPLILTFILMVLFTAFTVGASIKYNRQVIAHIGLVGAYAVPFLLGDESGKIQVLFGYIALINTGILVIAFTRRWKSLYYSSFLLTWLIFFTWYMPKYDVSEHFGLALFFILVFFITFYLIFLADWMIRKEKHKTEDILCLLANSGVFFGLGYTTLNSDITGEGLRGLFTLGNALIHFMVAVMIWMRRPTDRELLFYLIGMGLVFITIAIPVQLDGHWVTLLWSGEAAALFFIGRTKSFPAYELLAYPLMIVVFFSIIHDWQTGYNSYDPQQPETRIVNIFNINFLTSIFFVISFGFIQYVNSLKRFLSPLSNRKNLLKIMNVAIPVILLFVLFFSFIHEISTFWDQLYDDSLMTKNQDLTVPQFFRNEDLQKYNSISIFNYSLLFFSLLSVVNIKWLRKPALGLFNLGLNTIVLGLFLSLGLYAIGELRESFLNQSLSEFYYRGNFNIGIRYISFVFAGLGLYSIYRYVKEDFIQPDFKMEFELVLHTAILIIISNELINWMDLYKPGQSYKLGLSILFGVYALVLIALGIWKKKAHLRIAAIALFAVTLLKLFFYDLTDLDTISKTIVFVILGILLLIISFLYNKYRAVIFGEREEERDT
ncbi:MAG: DUF2339 domain-containing protein [Bacteroidales bacterium]|nr:DUF2339 domain-containing protein [Bacteroidales bacterium]